MLNTFRKLFDRKAYAGVPLKYGAIKGEGLHVTFDCAASVPFKANYGRFVYVNASGNIDLVIAATATVVGSAVEFGTSSSTAAATKMTVNIGYDVVYRLPVQAGTYSKATYCWTVNDLGGTSGAQGVALGTNSNHHVLVIGGDETNNKWVDCILNMPAHVGR